MRLPRLPPPVSRAVDLLLAVLVPVALLSTMRSFWGWRGVVVGALALLVAWLFWPLPVPDDEGCLKCGHANIHHQGNCQACLRDRKDGRPLPVTPCARFRRWSPRTHWERLRRARGQADHAPEARRT
jgi:hypothetical protein